MYRGLLIWGGVLLAASAHAASTAAPAGASGVASACATTSFACWVAKIDEALGRFNDITVFKRPTASGPWQLAAGQYVPVTVDNKTPTRYVKNLKSDRPMMLPTRVQGFDGGDGQSTPFSVVGRMPGSNPEVRWVFVVRKYSIMKPTDADFPNSGDMAVIGHHPRTGATTYLQFYDPNQPKSGEVVVSPFSPKGESFWSPMTKQAEEFQCQRCHNAGPFIHTPWINQVTIGKGAAREPIVPLDSFGPFFYVYADEGEPFAPWNQALLAAQGGGHLKNLANKCTQCHRAAPSMIGLNQNATRYAGLAAAKDRSSWALKSDENQTDAFRKLHWMPVLDPAMIDFYAGQQTIMTNWDSTYGASAKEINELEVELDRRYQSAGTNPLPRKPLGSNMVDVPRPPKAFEKIVVDRPLQDRVAATQSLWVVDSRMRANTDGDLQHWRFYAKASADAGMQAAPVVYRRKPNDGSTIDYEVVFVGQAQTAAAAGNWLPVQSQRTFRVKQGDTLGVVFTPTGTTAGSAFIPYTEDDWAKLQWPDGSTRLRDGSVTYWLATPAAPRVGAKLQFKDAGFRTYSLEFKNRL